MAKISELPRLVNPAGTELVPAVNGRGETVGVAIGVLASAAVAPEVARAVAAGDAAIEALDGLTDLQTAVVVTGDGSTLFPTDATRYGETHEDDYGVISRAVLPDGTDLTNETTRTLIGPDDRYTESHEDDYGLLTRAVRVDGSVMASHSVTTPVAAGERYADSAEDDYGVLASMVTRTGVQIGGIDPALSAITARLIDRPDGVVRYPAFGGWLYCPTYGESLSIGSQGNNPPAFTVISNTQAYRNKTFRGGVQPPYSREAGYPNPDPDDPRSPEPGLLGDPIPLIEQANAVTPGETLCSGLGSAITEYALLAQGVAPGDMPVFVSTAGQGAQKISDLSKGGMFYSRFMRHIEQAKARAADAGVPFYMPCWVCAVGANDGASDYANGLTREQSRANYLAGIKQLAIDVDADARAITGQTQPIVMLLYQLSGAFQNGPNAEGIRLAQLDAVRQSPLIEFAGPWYDLQYIDGVHLRTQGYLRAGRRAGACAGRWVWTGRTRALVARSATVRGSTLRLRYNEPAMLDGLSIPLATDFGIRIVDQAGVIAVRNVRECDGDILVDLARAPGTAPIARVALDYHGLGLTNNGCPSANIRAAAAGGFERSGVGYRTFDWAPGQELPIVILEH